MRTDPEQLRTIWLVGALAATLLALTLIFGPPQDGLSESHAIGIAARDARASSTTIPHFVLARPARLYEFFHPPSNVPAPADQWVWAVVFTGLYPGSGGPPPGRQTFAHSRLVLIDYFNGEFVMASEPSPIPWGIGLN